MIKDGKFEWGNKEIPFISNINLDGSKVYKEEAMIVEPVKYAKDLTFWEKRLESEGIPYAVWLIEHSYKVKGRVESACGFTIIIDTHKHSVNFIE